MVFVVSIQQDVMILHSYGGINIDIGIATLNNMQFMKAAIVSMFQTKVS